MARRILRIGLTGGIASGKSTACDIFSGLGVPVIDADQIVHKLTKKDGIAYSSIVQTFGHKFVMDNGEIDRQLLRERVFGNTEDRKKLENILHPLVFSKIEKQISLLNHPYCIICIPLLVETMAQDRVDRILVIDAAEKRQIERACNRDSSLKNSIHKIIETQAPRELRLEAADDVIHNDEDIGSLRKQILALHEKYSQLAKSWH